MNLNTPKFYQGREILSFSLRTALKYFILQNKEIAKSGIFATLKSLRDSIRLRKKLYLTKLIRFNNKYYSTPIIPSFPSNAFNQMIKNGGQNFLDAGTSKKRHIDSAFIAITNQCNLKCTHCYEQHNLYDNSSVPTEKIVKTINQLQKMGVSIIILTGGEPLIEFDKLEAILNQVDLNLSEFHIHTSGNGLTLEKAKKLKGLGISAAAVGLDHFDHVKHDALRGKGSYEKGINALKLFNEVGILTYVNLCATDAIINTGEIWDYYNLMKQLRVSIIELLEPRPYGGYYDKDINNLLSDKNKKELLEFMKKGNTEKVYKDHPLIYYVAHIEGANQMGCMMGGLSHFYIDSKGNVNPCVFLPVTFGNIMKNDFQSIYKKMRTSIPHPVHKECPSVLLSKSIVEKTSNGSNIPIPVEKLKDEWNELFKN